MKGKEILEKELYHILRVQTELDERGRSIWDNVKEELVIREKLNEKIKEEKEENEEKIRECKEFLGED